MNRATVVQAGYVEHPESGNELLRVTTDKAWASAGVTYGATDIWIDRDAPVPLFGDVVEWDGHHAWLHGVRYRKPEYDSNPAAPLH